MMTHRVPRVSFEREKLDLELEISMLPSLAVQVADYFFTCLIITATENIMIPAIRTNGPAGTLNPGISFK